MTSGGKAMPRDEELQRKRARDRKSQQAMRDRSKTMIQNLSGQVTHLSQMVEDRDRNIIKLGDTLQSLKDEIDHLNVENGALRLKLIGQATESSLTLPCWKRPPVNTAPTCISDQIIQDFLTLGRDSNPKVYDDKANLCHLLDQTQRPADALSNIVSDIILSYKEIETLPKQVSLFHAFTALLKWQVTLDEASWSKVPTFFRPTNAQLTTPHPAWIERVPWPRVRDYLIEHPEITLDMFAIVYSTNFNITWPYDPRHVVLVTEDSNLVIVNPVFEEHIQQISNWTITDAFKARFPEMADLVDADTRPG
ncbi:uncharacterized protein LTR77_000235 [Saxophila tyrrhenica]|uniref:BZIP domain-containing protein n=1 Tax=Saxophila tyrrhenica TaxID=1690608 RepID=A0AAV9PP86_9PEZI|nr:hypothetical protein LTR77_000235 [Saxophila tyrrhenica]